MAKLETELWSDFDGLLEKIQRGILNGNASATWEDASDFFGEDARCSVRVFERYSAIGSNRVSLNITLFQCGGGQAVIFKMNTLGERSFLDCVRKILE